MYLQSLKALFNNYVSGDLLFPPLKMIHLTQPLLAHCIQFQIISVLKMVFAKEKTHTLTNHLTERKKIALCIQNTLKD